MYKGSRSYHLPDTYAGDANDQKQVRWETQNRDFQDYEVS